jgi:hypothetical protein
VTFTALETLARTLRRSFDRCVVAVTIVDKRLAVLDHRPLAVSGKEGDVARFEAVAVPLEPTASQ